MRTFLFLALTVPLLVPGTSWSLTIYRIGGSDSAPPPEAGLEGVEFASLSWEAAAQGFDGKMQGLALEEAGIAPVLVSPDDNLALTAPARGGGPAGFAIKRGRNIYGALVADKLVDKIADGDPTTAFRLVDDQGLARFSYASPGTFLLDLGWRFPINRIRFYPTPQYSGRNVEEFAVQVVEGSSTGAVGSRTANWQKIFNSLFPDGTRSQRVAGAPRDEWTIDVVGSVSPNRQRAVDFLFPTRTVEYVALTVAAQEMWEVAELEVYGEGYVPRAFYQSQVLDLGAISTLGTLRWTGSKDDEGPRRNPHPQRLGPGSRPLLALHWPRRRADLPRRRGPAPNPHRLPKPVLRPRPYHPGSGPLERLVGRLFLRRQLGDPHDLARTAALRATTDRFRHQGRACRGA